MLHVEGNWIHRIGNNYKLRDYYGLFKYKAYQI